MADPMSVPAALWIRLQTYLRPGVLLLPAIMESGEAAAAALDASPLGARVPTVTAAWRRVLYMYVANALETVRRPLRTILKARGHVPNGGGDDAAPAGLSLAIDSPHASSSTRPHTDSRRSRIFLRAPRSRARAQRTRPWSRHFLR